MKTTIFDMNAPLKEEVRPAPDHHVSIIAQGGSRGTLDTSRWSGQIVVESGNAVPISENVRDLCFTPYYLRANRGGKGQMRVGLRVE
jgi:hypothetical protein